MLRIKPELIKGSGGVFEIKAGGELVFSKKQTGRFPETGEILSALHRALDPQASSPGTP